MRNNSDLFPSFCPTSSPLLPFDRRSPLGTNFFLSPAFHSLENQIWQIQFSPRNTKHSFLKKFAHANRLTLIQEMGPAVFPSVATRQFNHLFCNDKRNWVACNLHREYFLKQLSVAMLTFNAWIALESGITGQHMSVMGAADVSC